MVPAHGLPTVFGKFCVVAYRSLLDGAEHLAILPPARRRLIREVSSAG
ncbi:hypothetical protein [Nocardia brasiliensis]